MSQNHQSTATTSSSRTTARMAATGSSSHGDKHGGYESRLPRRQARGYDHELSRRQARRLRARLQGASRRPRSRSRRQVRQQRLPRSCTTTTTTTAITTATAMAAMAAVTATAATAAVTSTAATLAAMAAAITAGAGTTAHKLGARRTSPASRFSSQRPRSLRGLFLFKEAADQSSLKLSVLPIPIVLQALQSPAPALRLIAYSPDFSLSFEPVTYGTAATPCS